jgi:hypothetical protein
MTRTVIEMPKLKSVGAIAVKYEALSAPPMPPVTAPKPKASSFVRTRLTPDAAAAVSSSRMATQARPRLESRSDETASITSTTRNKVR